MNDSFEKVLSLRNSQASYFDLDNKNKVQEKKTDLFVGVISERS